MAGDRRVGAKSDLPVRAASAVVMVAVAGTALWLGGVSWNIFVIMLSAGVLFEWTRLVIAFASGAIARLLWMVCGISYIGVALMVLLILRSEFFGIEPVLTLLSLVVAVDVGAYFAGRTFGGPKIAPAISPSKTWSGLLGAMVGATAVLMVAQGVDWRFVLIGPVAAVVAQAGDFFESWMKRRAGVKDSSHLIPGHGGLFDRLDGLLAVLFATGLNMAIARYLELL